MNIVDLFWTELSPETREVVLRILLAILALAFVWLARQVLAAVFVAPIRRLTERSEVRWDDILLDAMILPVRFLILAFGLWLGAQILQVSPDTGAFVLRLIRTLVIVAIFLALYRGIDVLTPTSNRLFRITGLSLEERLLPFVRTAIKLILFAVTIVIIIQEWGYDVSGLIAGLGLGGLAFSLAAQDTIKNLFGFTTIVSDQPFVVGEFIKTPDVEGTVEHVGVRSTRVRQPDQAYVVVPNGKLADSTILNWSRLTKRWINNTIRLEYGTTVRDIERFMERVRGLLLAQSEVQADSVLVRLVNLGENGLEILIRAYLLIPDWGEFTARKEVIYLEILKILEEMGLSIAFPGRSVYIDTISPRLADGLRGASSPTEENET